jgi:hypothetical protein
MPKVIVDVSQVPDSDRQSYDGPTPGKGLYRAVWKRGWWTKTNDGKKTMLKVLFTLETDNPKKKEFNGYPVWHNVTYESSTLWKMKELFTALKAGQKAAVDYDDKGAVTRIGRARPGQTALLIHGKEGFYKGQQRLEVDTLAPLPGEDDEEDAGDEWTDDGDATPFEEAGGVSADEANDIGGDVQMNAGSSSDEEPPF